MGRAGEIFFGNKSRFVRWTLSPFIVLFAVFMPWLAVQCVGTDTWSLELFLIIGGMELMCIALLALFWLPRRYGRVGGRLLAGMVFFLYLFYVIDEFFPSDAPGGFFDDGASPFNALAGFVFIGLPSCLYAFLGRFSLRIPVWESRDDT